LAIRKTLRTRLLAYVSSDHDLAFTSKVVFKSG
jgi:hypothetical protein